MMKKVGIIKRVLCISLVFLLNINALAAVVSDNDGSAFITKAEFDSLKNNFQSQIDQYNQSIDSKIDGAIAAYLSGIQISNEETLQTFFAGEIETYSEDIIDRWWKPSQPKGTFTGTLAGASYENSTYASYTNPQIVQWKSVCNGKAGKQTVIKYNDTGTRDTSFPVFDFVGEGWYDNITFTSLGWMKNRNGFRPLSIADAVNGTAFTRSGSDVSIRDGWYTTTWGQKTVHSGGWEFFPFHIYTTSSANYYDPNASYSITNQSSITPPQYKDAAGDWKNAYWPNGEHPLKTGITVDSILAKTSQTYTAKRQAALNYVTSSQKLLVFDHEYDTGWNMPKRDDKISGAYDTAVRSGYPFWWKYGYDTPFDYWSAMKPDTWIFNFSYNDYMAAGPGKYGTITLNDWSTVHEYSSTTPMGSSYCYPPLMAGWPYLMNMSDIYSNIKISTRTGPAPAGAVEKNGNFYLKWTAGTPLCYTPKAGNVKFDLISDSEVDLWVKLAPFNNADPNSESDVFDRTKINLPASSTKNRAVRLPSGTSTVSFDVPSACYIFLKWGSTTDWKDGGKLTFPNDVTFTAAN